MSWPLVQLGDVANISAGNSAPQGQDDFSEEGTPFVRAGSLSDLLKGATSHLERIAKSDAKRLKLRLFPMDSILFAKSGMSCMKGYVYRLPFEAHVVSHLAVVQPGPDLFPAYAEHALRVFSPVSLVKDEAYPSIRLPEISGLKIPLPPLEEQRRIAGILDQADALRRLRSRALDKLNTLGQAIFHEMFGDGLPSNTNVRLGDVTLKIGSGATPRGGDSAYKSEGIPLIRSMNVRDGVFSNKGLAFIDDEQASKLDNVIVEANDVLLNITGASVARVCIAPRDMNGARVNQHVAIIRCEDSLLPEFLEAFLLLPSIKAKLLNIAEAGATRQAITKAQIQDFQVPKFDPSEQKAFVERRKLISNQRARIRTQEIAYEALFASLQHRAFKGEL